MSRMEIKCPNIVNENGCWNLTAGRMETVELLIESYGRGLSNKIEIIKNGDVDEEIWTNKRWHGEVEERWKCSSGHVRNQIPAYDPALERYG